MPNDTPYVYVPSSMREAIAELDLGESYSKCTRIPLSELSRVIVTDTTSKMRNTLNSAMRRAMSDVQSTYTLETGHLLTTGALIVVGIVTRTE